MVLQTQRYQRNLRKIHTDDVKNDNDPTPGNISEEKESELDEFIEYAKVIVGTLGHIIFRKGPVSVEISNSVSAELLSRIGDIFHAE